MVVEVCSIFYMQHFTGLQYVLNRNAHVCHQSVPIDIKMGDVKVQNNTFSLKEPDELILGIASQEFYYAGKVSTVESR
jgi:hypothetical protein